MVFSWATSGPYEGHTVTFIEEYRGYKIYYLTGPGGLYGFVDPAGDELNQWRNTLVDARAYVDDTLGPEVPPEPEPPARVYFQTYRGIQIFKYEVSGLFAWTWEHQERTFTTWNAIIFNIDAELGPLIEPDTPITTWGGYEIWLRSIDSIYYIMVDGLPQGEFTYLLEAQQYIEDVLGGSPSAPPIEPGEEPDYTKMTQDAARAAMISGPINTFLTSVGLTPEALGGVMGSGADPEKAAQFAQAVSTASVGAVAILGTIGVVAEVASLGQVETVHRTIDMVLEKTGISGLLDELFRIPFMSALVTPAHHHWNSIFTPELSGLSQITRELVREVISLETYLEEAAMQGLSNERAMRVWDSHWRELGIRDTDIILHRGGMTEEEWEKYRVIQDYRPDPRPGFALSDLDMSKVLRKTMLGRVDTRRAYQYGMMERPDLITMYLAQGYEDAAEMQADIQIRASVDGLQSAIRREEGMMYRDRIKDAREDESAAVAQVLTERDVQILITTLRWNIEAYSEVDLMLIPDAYKNEAAALGPLTEEEGLVLEASLRAAADAAIAEVRTAARAREEEAEAIYRTALEEVKTLIDPEDLWVLRYRLAADRVEVAEEFEIEAPTLVAETAEEPE